MKRVKCDSMIIIPNGGIEDFKKEYVDLLRKYSAGALTYYNFTHVQNLDNRSKNNTYEVANVFNVKSGKDLYLIITSVTVNIIRGILVKEKELNQVRKGFIIDAEKVRPLNLRYDKSRNGYILESDYFDVTYGNGDKYDSIEDIPIYDENLEFKENLPYNIISNIIIELYRKKKL